jgi:serine/threonine-protein kinase RsbW
MTPATPQPDMELALPARAENIAVVRHALGALGEACAVDEQLLSDIRLAVTEACTNVVVHAYPADRDGPLEVLASVTDDELTVLVRDSGPGIAPHPSGAGLGLGLPLIASLTESLRLGQAENGHTEVSMTFSLAPSSDFLAPSSSYGKPTAQSGETTTAENRSPP